MIVQAPNPRGIDWKLQKFQSALHTHLISKWGIVTSSDYMCYDRCYRNQSKDGFYPEVYQSNGEYKEVLIDDSVKALSFFGIGNRVQYIDGANQADVHLIFFVNLESLRGTGRRDEQVRQDVQEFVSRELYGFKLNEIILGIDRVFADYSGFRVNEAIKHRDINPYHCFRFNMTQIYHFNDHQCN